MVNEVSLADILRFLMVLSALIACSLEEKVPTMPANSKNCTLPLLTSWSIALQKFREHAEKSPVHHTATILASQFKLFMQQKATSIDVQLDTIRKKQIQKNRE